MPSDNPPRIEGLRSAALLKGSRSSLQRWYERHFHDVREMLAEIERPGWRAMAEYFAEHGLTDRAGNPPTEASARLIWRTVVRARNKAGRLERPVKLPPRVTEVRPAVLAPVPADETTSLPTQDEDDDPFAGLRTAMNERSGRK